MKCLYCGTTLSPLRNFTGGEFCSDQHRIEYQCEGLRPDYLFLIPPRSAAGSVPKIQFSTPGDILFGGGGMRGVTLAPKVSPRQLPSAGPVESSWTLAASALAECQWNLDARPLQPRLELPAARLEPRMTASEPGRAKRSWFIPFDRSIAPSSWRLLACLVPVVLLAAFHGAEPVVRASSEIRKLPAIAAPLAQVRANIQQRAAVILSDDFRSGLDEWESRSGLAKAWDYDNGGFVRPGALAVYRPTMGLSDYKIEFLGQIEQRGLGVAFRIRDWNNYFALKIATAQSGSRAAMNVIRYAVVDGRETGRSVKTVLLPVGNLSLCRIALNVQGSDFTLITQGQIVDYWSDGRFTQGGVGFFCGNGERARIRWIEVSHQYDTLGRICALLAPPGGRIGIQE